MYNRPDRYNLRKVVTVTVAYKHDWGTTSFDFTIEVIRNAKP